jgi:glycosyltransferase involved in cell wall biosynthesis
MRKEYDFCFVMSPISLTYPSGGIKIIYKLAKKLAQKKYKVAMLFLTDPFRIARTLFPGRKNIRNMGIMPYLIKNLLNNRFSFKYIVPDVRKLLGVNYTDDFSEIDIFFSGHVPNGLTSKRYYATDYVTAFHVAYEIKPGKRYFISLHNEADPVYLGHLSWLAKKAYQLPLKLIVINDDMMRLYAEKKPVLFHVGIEDYFSSPPSLEEKQSGNRILIPLREGEMKGAVYGIEAARLVNENIRNVTISAYGNYQRDKVPSFIEYHYLPSNSEVLELYRKATVFVLPSILEGMSLPPLEAMASGCVVVSADCVGIRVYLKHEFNSIIVPVRDSKALFTAVQRLLADSDLMEMLRANGIKTASQFTYDKMVDEFLAAVQESI